MKNQISALAVNVVLTNWIVVTGAPCCGKSTLIRELRAAGHEICKEAAERYVLSQRRIGKTTASIIADRGILIAAITRLALDQEAKLSVKKQVFLDRSALDTAAYCVVFGEPIPYRQEVFQKRHAGVFLLDRLKLTADRLEDDEQAVAIDQALQEQYARHGHTVIRVPVLPVAHRVQFVLDRLPSLSHE